MCGNWISNPGRSAEKAISNPGKFLKHNIGNIAALAAAATGQYWAIPLAEGLGNAATTKLQGGSWGDALKSGAISGATSYVGGQALSGLGDLASSAFPETTAAVNSGLGQARSALFGAPAADAGLANAAGSAAGDSAGAAAGNAGTFNMAGTGAGSGAIPYSSLDTTGLDQLASSGSDAAGGAAAAGGKSFTPWYTADDLGVGNVPGLKQVANFTGNHPYMTLGAGGLGLAAASQAAAAKKQQEAAAAAQAAAAAKDNSLNETWQAMLRQQPLQRNLNPNNADVDYANYGAGPEHLFYDNVNPPYSAPIQIGKTPSAATPIAYAKGGPVKVPATLPVLKGSVKARPATGGQADKIPANLSQDEHVIPADVVAHLGDGSSDAGHEVLQKLIAAVRNQKTKAGTKLPPPAKSPTKYMEAR